MQLLEKLWEMWENIKIINLSEKKAEETTWCQIQIMVKKCNTDTDNLIVYIKIDDFINTLQGILKQDLLLQIMNKIDHCLKEKRKNYLG